MSCQSGQYISFSLQSSVYHNAFVLECLPVLQSIFFIFQKKSQLSVKLLLGHERNGNGKQQPKSKIYIVVFI